MRAMMPPPLTPIARPVPKRSGVGERIDERLGWFVAPPAQDSRLDAAYLKNGKPGANARRGSDRTPRDSHQPKDDIALINNRQNGRRRGRNNGPRPEGNAPTRAPNGGGGGGSRIDNRQRGNAHQLHEKYKTLARDSQMQGDRVTAEYYLQYADHYFRVLNEGRVRQEEFRTRQREWDGDGEGEDERGHQGGGRDGGDAGMNGYRGDYDQGEAPDGNGNGNGNSNGNGDSRQRYERPDNRREAPPRNDAESDRAAETVNRSDEQEAPRAAPRPRGRPPRQPRPVESESERFDLVGLPPRASVAPPVEPVRAEPVRAQDEPEEQQPAPAPRRRGRPKKSTELTEA